MCSAPPKAPYCQTTAQAPLAAAIQSNAAWPRNVTLSFRAPGSAAATQQQLDRVVSAVQAFLRRSVGLASAQVHAWRPFAKLPGITATVAFPAGAAGTRAALALSKAAAACSLDLRLPASPAWLVGVGVGVDELSAMGWKDPHYEVSPGLGLGAGNACAGVLVPVLAGTATATHAAPPLPLPTMPCAQPHVHTFPYTKPYNGLVHAGL